MALTPFLLGKDLTAIAIYPLTIDSSGVITVGSGTNVKPFILSVEGIYNETVENIQPVWDLQDNEVRTAYGNALRVSLLQRADAANFAVSLVTGYGYCRVVWVQGASTFTGNYKIRSLSYGVNSRGQNANNLDLGPISDAGSPNIAVT